MEHQQFYDELCFEYDLMINWEARLARELPFFYKLFNRYGVKSVLDCACASGKHAIAFSQAGYQVIGCDISPQMIKLAQQNADLVGANVGFIQCNMKQLTEKINQSVDAIICLGNTLPHLHQPQDLSAFFQQAYQLLNPGGIIIVQILNYTSDFKKQRRTHPIRQGEKNGKEYYFIRIFDYLPNEMVQGNFMVLERFENDWRLKKVNKLLLKAIFKPNVESYLLNAGFTGINYFGDYNKTPWQEDSSDLIAIAFK